MGYEITQHQMPPLSRSNGVRWSGFPPQICDFGLTESMELGGAQGWELFLKGIYAYIIYVIYIYIYLAPKWHLFILFWL